MNLKEIRSVYILFFGFGAFVAPNAFAQKLQLPTGEEIDTETIYDSITHKTLQDALVKAQQRNKKELNVCLLYKQTEEAEQKIDEYWLTGSLKNYIQFKQNVFEAPGLASVSHVVACTLTLEPTVSCMRDDRATVEGNVLLAHWLLHSPKPAMQNTAQDIRTFLFSDPHMGTLVLNQANQLHANTQKNFWLDGIDRRFLPAHLQYRLACSIDANIATSATETLAHARMLFESALNSNQLTPPQAAQARCSLAKFFLSGIGGPIDRTRGLHLLEGLVHDPAITDPTRQAEIKYELATLYFFGTNGSFNYPLARQLCIELLENPALTNPTYKAEVRYMLACAYFYGYGGAQDYSQVYQLCTELANNPTLNNPEHRAEVQYMLAGLYFYAHAPHRNYVRARQLYEELAQHIALLDQHQQSQVRYLLALMYFYGHGGTQDYHHAWRLCKFLMRHPNGIDQTQQARIAHMLTASVNRILMQTRTRKNF